MTVKQVLDSIYIIPVILDHLTQPTATTSRILRDNGISPVMVENLRQIQPLLMYHKHVVIHNFKPDNDGYEVLRLGLARYFDLYLADFFTPSEEKNLRALDYGAGEGRIANLLREQNPTWDVWTLDRHDLPGNHLKIDFEKSTMWSLTYKEQFDLVILSEVLHCKNKDGQQYLVSSAHDILKKGGKLIIIEPIDYVMAYRIQKLKGQEINVLTEYHIKELCELLFIKTCEAEIHHHILYQYEKL